jgi:hypothetical protein
MLQPGVYRLTLAGKRQGGGMFTAAEIPFRVTSR